MCRFHFLCRRSSYYHRYKVGVALRISVHWAMPDACSATAVPGRIYLSVANRSRCDECGHLREGLFGGKKNIKYVLPLSSNLQSY